MATKRKPTYEEIKDLLWAMTRKNILRTIQDVASLESEEFIIDMLMQTYHERMAEETK